MVTDEHFTRVNLVFDGVQVKAKKTSKGTVRNTPPITPKDLKKIRIYFSADHVTNPEPRVLQHCVLFNIMYFFCQQGQENIYDMMQDHFKVFVEPDGTRYVYQNIDEKDKNHGINDTDLTNQDRMYEDKGQFLLRIHRTQSHSKANLLYKQLKINNFFSDSDICPVNMFILYTS